METPAWTLTKDDLLSKVKEGKTLNEDEYERLDYYFDKEYYSKSRLAFQNVFLHVPKLDCNVVVIGEETIENDAFLEIIKKDYNYVKYNIGSSNDSLYYRFDFYREKIVEHKRDLSQTVFGKKAKTEKQHYKISLKFYTAVDLEHVGAGLGDQKCSMIILWVDPRRNIEKQIELIDKLNTKFQKPKDDENNKEEEENKELSEEALDIKYPVFVVVNHCDSQEREIGTDRLLKMTQKYNFSLVELSSLSGVNLEFLINHILETWVTEDIHDKMDSWNVTEKCKKEKLAVFEKLKNIYGDLIE